jgi:hypothetical protein
MVKPATGIRIESQVNCLSIDYKKYVKGKYFGGVNIKV